MKKKPEPIECDDITLGEFQDKVKDVLSTPVNVDKLPKWENNKPTQDELHKKWKLEKGNNGWRLNEK